jgi:hypothetical protein
LLSIFNSTDLSQRVKKSGLELALVVALVAIYLAVSWLLFQERWVEEPVMLRILRGEVEIHTVHAGEPIPPADPTWLSAGNCIEVKQDSLAVLQYFEGSIVKIEGPAEVHLSWCRRLGERPQEAGRSISLEVSRGKVAVAITRRTAPHSLFELRTPNSVGIVQGTVLEVEVDEEGASVWEISQGTVKVGAITVGKEREAVVALIPLNAGDSAAIPPLPEEWREEPAVFGQLIGTARTIVKKSVKEERPDVKAAGVSLVAANPETGIAVFKVEKVVQPVTVTAPPPLPPDYKVVKDEV